MRFKSGNASSLSSKPMSIGEFHDRSFAARPRRLESWFGNAQRVRAADSSGSGT
jgi:hypothetical protein